MHSQRILVTFVLLSLLLPTAARAATRVVDVDGTYDAGTNGCAGGDPAFTTIQSAVTAAVDGDTVLVCPGTYNEIQITINKALSVQSVAGAAATIIDGGGGTGLAFSGTVVINATTGNVLFDGFTVQNAKAGPSSVRFNVRVGSPSATVTFTVTNNVLLGTNNPLDGSDYGLYAAGPNANDTLIFQYNQLYNHGSNTILIERHKGPTDVSYNTFTRGVRSTTISAYVNMSHTGDAITTLQKVSNNTIDMANDPGPYTAANASNAIAFIGALTGTTVGSFSNVEISGNTITNLRSFRRGIVLSNSANSLANEARGEIANALISCNTMTWTGATEAGSQGVRLQGFVSNPTITGNVIDGVDGGFQAFAQNGHIANAATFEQNSVTDTGAYAVDWQSPGPLTAENDWWGSATGPTNAGNPGGTGGIITSVGPVDFTPWLVSGSDADPGTCFVPGCGNGTIDPGEDCDQGALNGDPSSCCTAACGFVTAGASCADGDFCTQPDTCDGNGTCSGPVVDCDDANPCTDDACNSQAGGFLCVHTNNGSCIGPNCGNGVVDAGETCDPPNLAINPITNQVECRLDCTACGDGVVQANDQETCDDGNTLSGCRVDKPQKPLDDCLNSCRLPICDDPSKIKLTSGLDMLAFHGRLDAPGAIDFSTNHFVIQLASTDGTVIYRDSLVAGTIPQTTPTSWKYRNKAAKNAGGIYAMKIRGKDGYYQFTLQAYGDASGAVAEMRTQIFVGATEWALRGVWTELPSGKGWRLNKKSEFLEP